MYIPFYTKYKATKKDLEFAKDRIKELQARVLDLENEKFCEVRKLENLFSEIELEIPKQQYGSVKNLGNKILTITQKRTSRRKTY